ncbi:hypothetical protein [Rhodospira trueperi]|nr:hypothetical protein [Rhodospira trueperi]
MLTAWTRPDFIVRVMAHGADIVTGAVDPSGAIPRVREVAAPS